MCAVQWMFAVFFLGMKFVSVKIRLFNAFVASEIAWSVSFSFSHCVRLFTLCIEFNYLDLHFFFISLLNWLCIVQYMLSIHLLCNKTMQNNNKKWQRNQPIDYSIKAHAPANIRTHTHSTQCKWMRCNFIWR